MPSKKDMKDGLLFACSGFVQRLSITFAGKKATGRGLVLSGYLAETWYAAEVVIAENALHEWACACATRYVNHGGLRGA